MVIWRDNLVIRTTISYELPLTRNFIGQICEFSHIMYRYNLADLLISCYKQAFCHVIAKHIRGIKGHNNFCSVEGKLFSHCTEKTRKQPAVIFTFDTFELYVFLLFYALLPTHESPRHFLVKNFSPDTNKIRIKYKKTNTRFVGTKSVP